MSTTAPSPTAARRSPRWSPTSARASAISTSRSPPSARRPDHRVTLVRDRDLARTIRSLYGIDRARRIQRSLEPQCLSGFRKDESSRILHSDVHHRRRRRRLRVLRLRLRGAVAVARPINDDTTVPWTHVQRRRPDGILRSLRSVPAQHPLRPAHPARHDARGGRGAAAGGAAAGARLGGRDNKPSRRQRVPDVSCSVRGVAARLRLE